MGLYPKQIYASIIDDVTLDIAKALLDLSIWTYFSPIHMIRSVK